MSTLIVVDVQRDFIDGALPVPNAIEIARPLEAQVAQGEPVLATRDWHPATMGEHFKRWPAHCVENTPGAMRPLWAGRADQLFSKGADPDADSYDATAALSHSGVSLLWYLVKHDIHDVTVCGLALDYCVGETALELRLCGLNVAVAIEATAPVSWYTGAKMLRALRQAGVELI